MIEELKAALADLSSEHLAQITAQIMEWAESDARERATLEAAFIVAAALTAQEFEVPVMWTEDEHSEIWVTRSEADDGQMSHTVEYRPKPGSPAARRAELEAQAVEAHATLSDPNATAEQITEAARVAALASLEGIIVSGS